MLIAIAAGLAILPRLPDVGSHVDNSKFVFQSSNCLQNGIDFMQMSMKLSQCEFCMLV